MIKEKDLTKFKDVLRSGRGFCKACEIVGADVSKESLEYAKKEEFYTLCESTVSDGYVKLVNFFNKGIEKNKDEMASFAHEQMETFISRIVCWEEYWHDKIEMYDLNEVDVKEAYHIYGPNMQEVACALGSSLFDFRAFCSANHTLRHLILYTSEDPQKRRRKR